MTRSGNIYEPVVPGASELIEQLSGGRAVRIERIVSRGHASPKEFWYDQGETEFVVLLSGRASVRFEGSGELRHLEPGDWLEIPAHLRHRVESTAPDADSVWLAVFFEGS